jgi:hypothetical protein
MGARADERRDRDYRKSPIRFENHFDVVSDFSS